MLNRSHILPVPWTRLALGIAALLFPLALAFILDEPPMPDSLAVRLADSFMVQHPDALLQVEGKTDTAWSYEQGLMLEAFHQMWLSTGDERYLEFIRRNLEYYVGPDGAIKNYRLSDFNLDNIAGGRALLLLFQTTGEQKYSRAAGLLRQQLRLQPRTSEGGFWHKKIYPFQMWLDGLYMAEPFWAWYSALNGEPQAFEDIADQFSLAFRHTRDARTGLCCHGWDESRKQRWADTATGKSPSFWGRAMGWYLMGLVDVLDFFPESHGRRTELTSILNTLGEALLQYQDSASGMWYQVVDQPARTGNYLETSASAMFAYAFAKGANKGYLDDRFRRAAAGAVRGIEKDFLFRDEHGCLNLKATCRGAGLGGTPYRDGSYAYYVSVPRVMNDMKGIGPLMLAGLELERGPGRAAK